MDIEEKDVKVDDWRDMCHEFEHQKYLSKDEHVITITITNGLIDDVKFKGISQIQRYALFVACDKAIKNYRKEKSGPFFLENIKDMKDKIASLTKFNDSYSDGDDGWDPNYY